MSRCSSSSASYLKSSNYSEEKERRRGVGGLEGKGWKKKNGAILQLGWFHFTLNLSLPIVFAGSTVVTWLLALSRRRHCVRTVLCVSENNRLHLHMVSHLFGDLHLYTESCTAATIDRSAGTEVNPNFTQEVSSAISQDSQGSGDSGAAIICECYRSSCCAFFALLGCALAVLKLWFYPFLVLFL